VGRRDLLAFGGSLLAAACGGAPPPAIEKPHAAEAAAPPSRSLDLPARPAGAPTGSQFLERTAALRPWEREGEVLRQVLAGNVPPFLRQLAPIALSDDGGHRGHAFVTLDYLAIGDDSDFIRIPITIRTAKALCKATRTILPTTHLVDLIYRQADARVTSPTEPPGREMGTNPYIESHNRSIEGRMQRAGVRVGELVAGEKKDVVISRRMLESPGRTPIYGWMRPDGEVSQPLSLVHDDRHVDYAHGIRLVDRALEIDGEARDVIAVLADKTLADLISDEGAYDLSLYWDKY
jgi:hypothetical protein